MDETATQDEQVLEEKGTEAQAPVTPASTEAKPVAGEELSKLVERLSALEAKQSQPIDPALIAEQVRQLPAFKQSMKAITENAVRAQIEAEIERRTSTVDELEAEGTLDADQAEKKRRDIAKKVRQEFANKPPEVSVDPAAPPPDQDRVGATQWLAQLGLTVDDVPEIAPGKPLPPFPQFLALATQRAADKRASEKVKVAETEWMKQYEEKTKQVREASAAGATKPPPTPSGPAQKKRTLADADRIGDLIHESLKR